MEMSLSSLPDEAFLVASWQRAWSGIGAEGSGAEVMAELLERYGEPARSYHNLEHLVDCLRLLSANQDLTEELAAVEMAVWFHDAIYDVQATDNEKKSAQWAADVLKAAGVEEERAEVVRALILATLHSGVSATGDQELLKDIDLSILGAPPERYDRYEAQIREEFSWVPEPTFRAARVRILSEFLERERIYHKERFYSHYEEAARVNLRRAIEGLQ